MSVNSVKLHRLIVSNFINSDVTADALVGVNAGVGSLVSGLDPDQAHRLAASGTPRPVKSIRVRECVSHLEGSIHQQSHPEM